MDLDLSNVYEVSVSAPQAGVGTFNTSNVAIFTHEVAAESFGELGYKIYISPEEVIKDFGTASMTAKLANRIFAQKPNIRANGGYLTVITELSQITLLEYEGIPTEGQYTLTLNGNPITILYNDTATQIQSKIRLISDLFSKVVVTGPAGSFSISFDGMERSPTSIISNNTMEDSIGGDVLATLSQYRASETPAEALSRGDQLVQFFGFMLTKSLLDAEVLSLGETVAPLRKIGFVGFKEISQLADGGIINQVRMLGYTNLRCIFHSVTPLEYCASFSGRGLCVNFSGNNTTLTMHLKDQVGILPDPAIGQTQLNQAQKVGAEVFVSFRGVPKTFTSGANEFFDNVYNLLWFLEELQVAEFNAFGQVSTKIPQTEQGVDKLMGVARKVCVQAVANGFIGAGEWTGLETFGPQEDFLENIRQFGYFLFSQPIGQQSVVDREDRKAPLAQIAIKYQGAMHSGIAIININK